MVSRSLTYGPVLRRGLSLHLERKALPNQTGRSLARGLANFPTVPPPGLPDRDRPAVYPNCYIMYIGIRLD